MSYNRPIVACCQYAPELGDVEGNISKVDTLISRLGPSEIDILCLPEMSFTGYVFKTKKEIAPFLEEGETGPTVMWAKRTAKRLKCYVLAGYPRKEKQGAEGKEQWFNSCCLVDKSGEVKLVYDKTFLYETDEGWATPGSGFTVIDLPEFGKVGIGICMDINPQEFKAPFERFEFANFHLLNQTKVIFLLSSWVDSQPNSDDTRGTPNYWCLRMNPILGRKGILVVCNRIGKDKEVPFCGCSCVIALKEPCLVGQLNKTQENLLVSEVGRFLQDDD